MIERQPVESSNLKEVGWEDNVLEVLFKSGVCYQYTGVPEEIFQEFEEQLDKYQQE